MALTDLNILEVRLRQIRLEASGIVSYELVPVSDRSLPAFTAGAHIDLHLPQERMRSYSLVNDPSECHRYVIAVQRDAQGRGGSVWLHTVPRVGDTFRVSAPSNDFPLADSASSSVLIAGGIGVTPILSMLHRLNRLERPWQLHYAARSLKQAAFVDEIRALAGDLGTIFFHFSDASAERLDLLQIVKACASGTHLYCCGPARMIDEFLALCSGRNPELVHVERFAASSPAATGGGFEVVLSQSGQHIAIEEGKTILDSLLDHGVAVQYSCSVGVCGTCRTGVIDGTPDHRDEYLTEDEKRANQSIMICCSGSRSKTLVLDL